MSLADQPSREGFCSAPWTDCITYADGALKACDRNVRSFGNWQEMGLKNAWESSDFQEFRRAIREGRYPDQDCASCHNNGTQRTAVSSLTGAYSVHYNYLMNYFGRGHLPELACLHPLLSLKKASAESTQVISAFFSFLENLKKEYSEAFHSNPEFHNAVVKLLVVAEALEDYLDGSLKPRRVATFRQSQLQAKCTARCVMCAGLYTGEIVSGPTLDEKYVDEAFAQIEDVTDFWCNGAEYLFYKEWKKIALKLAKEGIKLRLSTNGILLNEENIDFMIDNKILGFLTMSLDAATKETMETTRVRVNYEKNLQRIQYLLRRASETGQYLEFIAAFVMMKRNLHELPAFVRMIKSLMPENCLPRVTILCQPLENFSIVDYRRFVHQEHHVMVGEERLKEIFRDTWQASQETGLEVSFYNQKMPEFMEQGMPIPRFFPRQMDVDLFLADIRDRKPLWAELNFQAMVEQSHFGRDYLKMIFLDFAKDLIEKNKVMAETKRQFPDFSSALKAELPAYVDHFISAFEREQIRVEVGDAVIYARKYALRHFRPGDHVYSPVSRSAGKISKIYGGMALFHDGKIVPIAGGLHQVDSIEKNGRRLDRPSTQLHARALARQAFGRGYLYLRPAKEKFLGRMESPALKKISNFCHRTLNLVGVDPRSTH